MKEHNISKEMLVLPMEREVFRKKNEISRIPNVCNKFRSILKFFMYLLLILSLILIGYIALSEYETSGTVKLFCGTINDTYDEQMTVMPNEELQTMTIEGEERVMNFLQILQDSIADVDNSKDSSTTVSPFIQELSVTTAANAIDDFKVSTSIMDSDVEDKNIISKSEHGAKIFSSLYDKLFRFTTETPPSHSNEEVTDSSKYDGTFGGVESMGILSDEIISGDLEEIPSEEITEKLEIPSWNFFLSQGSFAIERHDEIDESSPESTSVNYDVRSTSINLNNDTLDSNYTNFEEVELFDPIPRAPERKDCKLSKDAVADYIETGNSNWSCESDEDALTVTEKELDSKHSTEEEYDYYEDYKIPRSNPFVDIGYFERSYPYWKTDPRVRTKMNDQYDDAYYDYMEENEKDVNEENQGKSMKEKEKHDEASERFFDNKSIEATEESTISSTDSYETIDNFWNILGTTSETPRRLDSSSTIEIESANNDDEIGSKEDIEFDELWDGLFSRLDTFQDEALSKDSFSEEMKANYDKILCMFLDFGLKNMLTNPVVKMTDEDRLAMHNGIRTIRSAVEICENIYNFTSVGALDHYIKTEINEFDVNDWEKENHKAKRSIQYTLKNHVTDNSRNRLIDEEEPASILRNAIQAEKMMLLQKMEQIDESDYQSLESNLETIFNRMELLSQHIDQLHERYLEMNELNDDYISKEFPMEFL